MRIWFVVYHVIEFVCGHWLVDQWSDQEPLSPRMATGKSPADHWSITVSFFHVLWCLCLLFFCTAPSLVCIIIIIIIIIHEGWHDYAHSIQTRYSTSRGGRPQFNNYSLVRLAVAELAARFLRLARLACVGRFVRNCCDKHKVWTLLNWVLAGGAAETLSLWEQW